MTAAPIPAPGELDDEGFADAWNAWAGEVVARWNARHPDLEPFDFARFDGCTWAADVCRHCCLAHDLRCHFGLPRAEADRLLRECIIAIGRQEDRHGWWWTATGWLYWLGVRTWSGWRP